MKFDNGFLIFNTIFFVYLKDIDYLGFNGSQTLVFFIIKFKYNIILYIYIYYFILFLNYNSNPVSICITLKNVYI